MATPVSAEGNCAVSGPVSATGTGSWEQAANMNNPAQLTNTDLHARVGNVCKVFMVVYRPVRHRCNQDRRQR
jgi:hypothetical protein